MIKNPFSGMVEFKVLKCVRLQKQIFQLVTSLKLVQNSHGYCGAFVDGFLGVASVVKTSALQ